MILVTDRYSVAQYSTILQEINNVFHMSNVARLPYTEEHYNTRCKQPQIKQQMRVVFIAACHCNCSNKASCLISA